MKRAKENPDIRAAIDKWDLYYHGEQNKEERTKALAELYMIVDEKSNEYELTDKGIRRLANIYWRCWQSGRFHHAGYQP